MLSTMINEGILMDLTDYVEKYCPNYVALLDANPDIKAAGNYHR